MDLLDATHTPRATAVVTPSPSRAAAAMADHLAAVPGVSLQRTSPGQAVPIVRGLIGSAVLLLVDGVRLNNALFRPSPNQYTSLVDPWTIARITVVKGPGSAPFGSDALGGVLAVTTALPSFSEEDWRTSQRVSVGAASADRSTVGHASFAAGRRDLAIIASLTAERHLDLRNGDGVRQAPSDYRAYGAQLAARVARGGAAATTAWLQYYEQPELPRTDELRPGFGQSAPAAEVWSYRPSRRLFAHLREALRDLGPLDELELHAAYQRIDDDRRIRDTGSAEELREDMADHGFTALARAAATLADAVVLGGLEAQRDLVTCRRRALDVTTGRAEDVPCRFPDGSTMTQLGLFGEARRAVTRRISARAGLRTGLSMLRITDLDATDDVDASAEVTTADWAAELGLELRASDELSFVANVGRGYRAPNIGDLSGLGPRPGNRYQEPADSLANEHALGGDVGVRLRHRRVSGEAYGFALRHEERIDAVPTGRTTSTGRQIVVSANVGTTTTYGLEVTGSLALRDDVEMEGALTWVRGTKDDRGEGEEPADRIPPLGGSLTARWRPIPALELEAGARFAAAQRRLSARDEEDPRIDPNGTDRFLVVSAGARYGWPSLQISARVENLADRQFREHASGVDAPGIDARLLVHWTRGY